MKKQKKNKEAVFKIEKSVFKKVIKANCGVIGYGMTILSGVKFEYSDGVLTLASTDGNRLLENKVEVFDGNGECSAVYNGYMLAKIQFLKNMCVNDGYYIDYLQFKMTPEKLEIWDIANNFTYQIGVVDSPSPFPPYKQLLPDVSKAKDGEYTTIALNVKFVEELKRMSVNPRTQIMKFHFKNNSPLACVLAESTDETTQTTSKSLIMPIQLRD